LGKCGRNGLDFRIIASAFATLRQAQSDRAALALLNNAPSVMFVFSPRNEIARLGGITGQPWNLIPRRAWIDYTPSKRSRRDKSLFFGRRRAEDKFVGVRLTRTR